MSMVSTSCGTLALNAAFLQEIKEDNVHLHHILRAATELCAKPRTSQPGVRRLAEILDDLRDQLGLHFALEEALGYFDGAIAVAPRLSIRADLLKAQHEALFRELCELVDDAERLACQDRRRDGVRGVVERANTFLAKLGEHEENEIDLIMESLYDDIGVGD